MSKSISIAHLLLPVEISLCTISFIIVLIHSAISPRYTNVSQLPIITFEVLLICILTTEEDLQEAHLHISAARTLQLVLNQDTLCLLRHLAYKHKSIKFHFIQVSQHCHITLTNLVA